MYAILIYRNTNNTIHAEILHVRAQPDLAWYYDTLQCGTIEHAVRDLYHKYEFIFDEEYLFRKQPGELPIAIAGQYNEQIFGRMLILPYIESIDDFAFFPERQKAEKVLKEVLDYMGIFTSDKMNYFSALKYSQW